MIIKAKKTGVVWEVEDGSPTAKRIKEQPEDYEIVEKKKGKGPE